MFPTKLITSLFGQANQSGERSTVVHTIIWLIGVVTVGVVFLSYFNAATWIIVTFLAMMVVSFVFFGTVFWYCLRHNPDLLRSEKMVIQKLAIEKQYVGDSTAGMFEEKSEVLPRERKGKLLSNQVEGGDDK